MVTMVTTPKSAGVNSRARMTVLTTWSRERQRRGGYRRCRASNGEASQFAAFGYRVEGAARVKWNHCLLEPVELRLAAERTARLGCRAA